MRPPSRMLAALTSRGDNRRRPCRRSTQRRRSRPRRQRTWRRGCAGTSNRRPLPHVSTKGVCEWRGTIMRVRLLGPVDIMVGGEERPVAGLRRKAVLATLALHVGEVVSTDRLVDAVWGETAPLTALNTLQHHVSHLRAMLGGKAAILARPPGYLLDLGEDGTDVQLAERLLRQGRQAADPRQGAQDLRQALGLWRGRALADVAGLAWLEGQAGRLDLLCQQIRRALAEAGLAAGEYLHLVPELEQMVADHPLDEQVHAQLMVALYRCGRQADALSAYQRLRATLAEELGIDTSQPLRDLETAILRQDPSLDAPVQAGSLRLSAPVTPLPAQLPPAVAGLTGRDAELAGLDAIVPPEARSGQAEGATQTFTFLFTDIEGSTALLRRLGETYAEILADHRRLIRAGVATHGGEEVDIQGDAS